MASDAVGEDVRARYLAVAHHFTVLAAAELRTDRLKRKSRLNEMHADRAKRNHARKIGQDET
jgi:hypothetical protein